MIYMMTGSYLTDGKYKTTGKLKWHEKARLKVAYWLFKSIPKPNDMEIITTTSAS